MAREITLVGMEHRPEMVPEILKECKASFKKGDRVAFEAPQALLDTYFLLGKIFGGVKDLSPYQKIFAGLPFEKRTTIAYFQLAEKLPDVAANCTVLRKSLESSTGWRLQKGLREMGIVPVGVDSYFVQERLGKKSGEKGALSLFSRNMMESVLRDRLFAKKMLRDKSLAGGLFGVSHTVWIRARLEKEGIRVKEKNVLGLEARRSMPNTRQRVASLHSAYNARKAKPRMLK